MKYKAVRKLTGSNIVYRKWDDWDEGEYVVGTLTGVKQDKYGKNSYLIEVIEDNFSNSKNVGKTLSLNSAGMLDRAMSDVQVGTSLKIEYAGKAKIEKGLYKGKDSHKFNVEVVELEEDPTEEI